MKNDIATLSLTLLLLLTPRSWSQDVNAAPGKGTKRDVAPIADSDPSKLHSVQKDDFLAMAKAMAVEQVKSGGVCQSLADRDRAPEVVKTLAAFRSAVADQVKSRWDVMVNRMSCLKSVVGKATIEMLLDDEGRLISSKIESSSFGPFQSEICLSVAAAAGPFPRLSSELQHILSKEPRRVRVQLVSDVIPEYSPIVPERALIRPVPSEFPRPIKDPFQHEWDFARGRSDKELCKRLSELGFKPSCEILKSR